MMRLMVLVLASAALTSPAAAAGAPATLAEQMTAFTSACNDPAAGAAALEGQAKAAKLKGWTKAEQAGMPPLGFLPYGHGEIENPKPDVVKGWWLDAGKTTSLTYREAKDSTGQAWRLCTVSAKAPEASAPLKAMLASETKPNPEAWTDDEGKWLAIFLNGGATGEAVLTAQVEKSVPFPGMTFLVYKRDPQWAPHTPHPISVTEAELFSATAQPGTVSFTRQSKIAK